MKLSLFDLHADTAWAMYETGQPLKKNSLAVSLTKAARFSRYIQTMALWTSPKHNDEEGYHHLLKMVENLKSDPALQSSEANLFATCPQKEDPIPSLILSVEDARILAGKLERVDVLADLGVRSVIPMWCGETCMGGSHDTEIGLTEFGKHACRKMLERNMTLDISHASEQTSNDIFELSAACGKPVIASHSNAHAICPVSRNLRDWQIDAIIASGGIIGINLYRAFLAKDENATLDTILSHIEYFLSRGAESAIALGCDMDGAELPDDIPDLSSLWRLAEHMEKKGYSQTLIDALFFENAYRFAENNF